MSPQNSPFPLKLCQTFSHNDKNLPHRKISENPLSASWHRKSYKEQEECQFTNHTEKCVLLFGVMRWSNPKAFPPLKRHSHSLRTAAFLSGSSWMRVDPWSLPWVLPLLSAILRNKYFLTSFLLGCWIFALIRIIEDVGKPFITFQSSINKAYFHKYLLDWAIFNQHLFKANKWKTLFTGVQDTFLFDFNESDSCCSLKKKLYLTTITSSESYLLKQNPWKEISFK